MEYFRDEDAQFSDPGRAWSWIFYDSARDANTVKGPSYARFIGTDDREQLAQPKKAPRRPPRARLASRPKGNEASGQAGMLQSGIGRRFDELAFLHLAARRSQQEHRHKAQSRLTRRLRRGAPRWLTFPLARKIVAQWYGQFYNHEITDVEIRETFDIGRDRLSSAKRFILPQLNGLAARSEDKLADYLQHETGLAR